jgi:hypothetical protein
VFIKNVSTSAPWDGTDKFVYALFYDSSTPSSWEDKTTAYTGKYIKMSSAFTTGVKANSSHTHVFLGGNSEQDDEAHGGGVGGYRSDGIVLHSHPITATFSTEEIPDPPYVMFRLFRKLLGKMVIYNDALTNIYTNGLYESPALQLKTESFGKLYFNARLVGEDVFKVFFRSGLSQSAVSSGLSLVVDTVADTLTYTDHGYSNGDRIALTADAYPSGLLGTILYYAVNVTANTFQLSLTQGGSAIDISSEGTSVSSKSWSASVSNSGDVIAIAVNPWIQYLMEFSATNSTSSNPTLYSADGFLLKFSYRRAGAIAETSVEFIYETGEMNHDEPMVDKIYKRIASEHVGTIGSFTVIWETENASGQFTFDLARFPRRWQSFFQDNAMGEKISLRFYKNDLYDLTLKEFKGFYTPQPMLI